MQKAELYKRFIDYFSKHMPIAETELEYTNAFELLVATVLSAQCTDKRVNIITEKLFKKYSTPQEFAKLSYDEVLENIKSCSYPNSKAHYIVDMSKQLVAEYNGKVPSDIDELMKLPGVGRKTASVVLAVAFKKPAMPVDTHVFRVSARIGLTTNAKTPLETEKQLVKYIPKDKLNIAHHWLILHGRYVCIARNPKCPECGIKNICNYYKRVLKGV